jgi:hypothetical protein
MSGDLGLFDEECERWSAPRILLAQKCYPCARPE